MNRRINILNNIISMLFAIGAILAVVLVCNAYYSVELFTVILYLLLGAVIAGFVVTALHELGHVMSGKKNDFAFISLTIWFFRWQRVKDKIRFSFVMMGDAVGSTEMVAKHTENLSKRFYKMTLTASIIVGAMVLIGVVPLFLAQYLPLPVFAIWAMFFPIGAYTFFGNILPMSAGGVKNDGALLSGLKKCDDESKVVLSLVSIQSELYNGKTPSEIDKSLYFDLPQLPEDNLNFIMLLNARYAYYLDAEDYENAKKVSDRLATLVEYMPKYVECVIKADALYNACTFDFNAEIADDLTFELEKYLNKVNSAENIRIKIAYNLYVKKEKDGLDDFYNLGIKECNKNPIEGLKKYEKKLLQKMKDDILAD